jgi:hypothetical protein
MVGSVSVVERSDAMCCCLTGSYSSLWEPNGFYLFLGYLAQIILSGIPALLLLLTLTTHWDSWGKHIFVMSSDECDQPLVFFLFMTLLLLSLYFVIATGENMRCRVMR